MNNETSENGERTAPTFQPFSYFVRIVVPISFNLRAHLRDLRASAVRSLPDKIESAKLHPVEETSGHQMQAKPRWVLAGGCILAFLAAAVNADFMLRLGVSVSHLTGDLSRITSEAVAAGGHWSREAAILCLSVGGFVGGAATAGFFIHHPNLQLSRPYGRSIIFIGLLLMSTQSLAAISVLLTCFVAAWACGMQNALATRFRGVVLRTTHITGLLTDLGQLIGMRLRGHPIEGWKITTPLMLAAAFALGSTVGAILNLKTSIPVTVACGATYVSGGIVWSVIKRWIRPNPDA